MSRTAVCGRCNGDVSVSDHVEEFEIEAIARLVRGGETDSALVECQRILDRFQGLDEANETAQRWQRRQCGVPQ